MFLVFKKREGGKKAVMSSFNFIGTEYAGASHTLLNTVLRDEWGFRGFVLTDYFGGYGYQNADQEIRNGNDAMLVAYDTETNHVKDTSSATSLLAMRNACKNIMYTVVNSRAYEGDNAKGGLLGWQVTAIVIDVKTRLTGSRGGSSDGGEGIKPEPGGKWK